MDDANFPNFEFRSDRPGDYGLPGRLGTGILFPGEDPTLYACIEQDVFLSFRPATAFERQQAEEYADHCWWLRRLRTWEPAILMASAGQGLQTLLGQLMDDAEQAAALARKWARGEAAARTEVAELLKSAGIDPAVITAMSYMAVLPTLATVQRMIIDREKRRDEILSTLERRREAADRRRREASRYLDQGRDAVPRYIAHPQSEPAPVREGNWCKQRPE